MLSKINFAGLKSAASNLSIGSLDHLTELPPVEERDENLLRGQQRMKLQYSHDVH
jgi:hypothetical protein